MKKIRFGVIGMGAIGPSHIHAINQVEQAQIAAVCDIRPEAAEQRGKEHNVPYFTCVDEMVKSELVDAVSISTPSGLHRDPALAAIAAGKHVLVEKPLEITTERIDPMIATARQQGVKLACSFQYRFTPLMLRIKDLLDKGMLGDLYTGSAYTKWYRPQSYYDAVNWRGTWAIDGGGALMNQGIHIVDLFLWCLGDAEEVVAITETRARKVEADTLSLSLVRFANGARGVIEATTLAYPGFDHSIELYGSRGSISFTPKRILHWNLMEPTAEEETAKQSLLEKQAEEDAKPKIQPAVVPGTAIPNVDMGHGPVFADFVEAIQTGREPLINGEEARKSVHLITSIYESGAKGSQLVRLKN